MTSRSFRRGAVILGAVGAGCGIAAALMRRANISICVARSCSSPAGRAASDSPWRATSPAEGARLALCAREPAELRAATDALRTCTSEVLAVPCDVGDAEQVENMINAVMQHYGRIDVLVNNAGVMQVGPLHTMTLRRFRARHGGDLLGRCTHHARRASPYPQERRRSHRQHHIDRRQGQCAAHAAL